MAIPRECALISELQSGQKTRFGKRLSDGKLRVGIGDDCAVLRLPADHEVLVTTDFSLETVHFRRDWHSPESAGHRCLARGLSDIAAMGATPVAAFLSLALPAELLRAKSGRLSWRDRFLNGLLDLADLHRVPLAGGDTSQSPWQETGNSRRSPKTHRGGLALADIVLVGTAPRNRALLRSGAKAGDRIYMTGHLGGAAAELAEVEKSPRRFRACAAADESIPTPHPHLFPVPRLEIGAWLLKNRAATAAIDLSDGLSTDLDHLCEESDVAAVIDNTALPIHPLAQKLWRSSRSGITRGTDQPLQLALHGGEDYELLFTASARRRVPRRIAGVPVSCIGVMHRHTSGQPRMMLREQQDSGVRTRPLLPGGWEHYRG